MYIYTHNFVCMYYSDYCTTIGPRARALLVARDDPAGTPGAVPGLQRHINGVVSKNKKDKHVGFGGIKRPF